MPSRRAAPAAGRATDPTRPGNRSDDGTAGPAERLCREDLYDPAGARPVAERAPAGRGRLRAVLDAAVAARHLQSGAGVRDRSRQPARAAGRGRVRPDGRLSGGQPAPLRVHAAGPAGGRAEPARARHRLRRSGAAIPPRSRSISPRGPRSWSAIAAICATRSNGARRSRRRRRARSCRSRATWWCRSRRPRTGTRSRRARCGRSCTGSGTPTSAGRTRPRSCAAPSRSSSAPRSISSDVDRALDRLELDAERRPGAPLSGRHRRGARAPRATSSAAASTAMPWAAASPAPTAARQLSPYLHFGQISPVEIALAGARRPGRGEATAPPTSRS